MRRYVHRYMECLHVCEVAQKHMKKIICTMEKSENKGGPAYNWNTNSVSMGYDEFHTNGH